MTITRQERDAIHDQLLTAAARVQQLERRLALREQEITAALTEIDELRTAVEQTDLSGLGLTGYSGQRPSPSPGEAAQDEPPRDATHGEASAMQMAELKRQLDEEREKRTQLERDLENLKVETSSGPFESRIQKDLDDARDQIERLQAALQVERQARERITREYDEVKARPPASGGETSASAGENLAAVQANQERLLATMRRQLEESERREKDLRDGLTAVQGEDAGDLAITVADLEAENGALQTRLDNEHVRNEDLAAKLRAAMRAADLIFRMNSSREAAPLP